MQATSDQALLPTNPSFAGHQTFALRAGWLKKGIDALGDPEDEGATPFLRDDAIVALGVGKNMVQSIRHWLLVTGMARLAGRDLEPTELGTALFGSPTTDGWDPYLEDPASLWLLHWRLAGPAGAAFSWVWTFNCCREYEFSRASLADSILAAATGYVAKTPSRETVMRDVECLLHTYAMPPVSSVGDELDCPLRNLGLIEHSYERLYRFRTGPKPHLPQGVFLYALCDYWRWRQADGPVSLWELAYAEGSPGAVFKLDEDSLLEYLDRTDGQTFIFEDTPQVRHVRLVADAPPDPLEVLRSYYV